MSPKRPFNLNRRRKKQRKAHLTEGTPEVSLQRGLCGSGHLGPGGASLALRDEDQVPHRSCPADDRTEAFGLTANWVGSLDFRLSLFGKSRGFSLHPQKVKLFGQGSLQQPSWGALNSFWVPLVSWQESTGGHRPGASGYDQSPVCLLSWLIEAQNQGSSAYFMAGASTTGGKARLIAHRSV